MYQERKIHEITALTAQKYSTCRNQCEGYVCHSVLSYFLIC